MEVSCRAKSQVIEGMRRALFLLQQDDSMKSLLIEFGLMSTGNACNPVTLTTGILVSDQNATDSRYIEDGDHIGDQSWCMERATTETILSMRHKLRIVLTDLFTLPACLRFVLQHKSIPWFPLLKIDNSLIRILHRIQVYPWAHLLLDSKIQHVSYLLR